MLVVENYRKQVMIEKLGVLFGADDSEELFDKVLATIEKYRSQLPESQPDSWFTQKDHILITYGDQINEDGKTPLSALHSFLNSHFSGTFSGVHILPFYPYSSDDGFSVIDYYQVDPKLGTWADIENLSKDYDIMFDGVINHISQHSRWFREYLSGNPKFSDYFIEADPNADYSTVTRPRALPLLNEFTASNGKKHVWTTFSRDQIDLNYRSPGLFLHIVDLLLFYISKGAKLIRLDAIGYMWKELGTSCINLEQAHFGVQLFRDIIEIAAPQTKLVTETNVPHNDNITYFGDGTNEAHMVYNFSLPPLTLYSFLKGDASYLSNWARSLECEPQSQGTTYFNFLASHDGIGVMPAKGILNDEEISWMVEQVVAHGGLVSYKNNSDGTKSPYEMNCNYTDALTASDEDDTVRVKKVLAAHALLLSFKGVPGIYIHSALGSRNYKEGVKKTGINRTINRQKFLQNRLEVELNDDNSLRGQIFWGLKGLISIRKCEPALGPNAQQRVLNLAKGLFAVERRLDKDVVIAITNVSSEEQFYQLELNNVKSVRDLILDQNIVLKDNKLDLKVPAYEVSWLKLQY